MTQFVQVQEIVGRRVRDPSGRVAGRIESIRAEKIGPKCVIQEYHLGTAAFLSRIGAGAVRISGVQRRAGPLRVPWQQMDLTDPAHPTIRCSLDELKDLQSQLPPFEDEAPPKRPGGDQDRSLTGA